MIEMHIILSTIVLLIMIVASVQALLIAFQDYFLKHDKCLFFLKRLPSLESSEKWLFRMIFSGFVLLTILLISSFIYFQSVFSVELRQKTILAMMSWIVFAGLLFGRMYWGLRGRMAIRWTLAGVLLLLIIYCGTGFFLNAY